MMGYVCVCLKNWGFLPNCFSLRFQQGTWKNQWFSWRFNRGAVSIEIISLTKIPDSQDWDSSQYHWLPHEHPNRWILFFHGKSLWQMTKISGTKKSGAPKSHLQLWHCEPLRSQLVDFFTRLKPLHWWSLAADFAGSETKFCLIIV